jgi:peptide/nickel transport system substrate-binding protein
MSFFYGLIGLKDPSQIHAVNSKTVEIVLAAPPPPFFLFVFGVPWAGIYDAGEVTRHTTSDDQWGKSWLTKNTAGFGPYKLTSTNADGSMTVLERNPYYWDKAHRGVIERQVHTFVPDTSNRLQLILSGSADLADTLAPLELNQVSKSKNAAAVRIATAANLFLGLDNSRPPFDDPAVRRGVALAVPYGSIIKNVYLGRAVRWRSLVPPQLEASVDAFKMNTDTAAAKKLLAKASGTPVTFSYVAGDTTQENIAIIVRQALQAAGLNVTAEALPRADFGVKKNGGQLQFWPDVVDSPAIPSSFYALAQLWTQKPIQPITHYETHAQAVQAAYERGASAKSIPARRAALVAAQRQLAKDVPSVPVCFTGTQVAASKQLTGFRSLTTAAMCLSALKWK